MNVQGTLGFMGLGNMGGAIASGLVAANTLQPQQILIFDVDAGKLEAAQQKGFRVVATPESLAAESDILLLAVKPQQMEEALSSLKKGLRSNALILSIAAGISIRCIQDRFGAATRVVRIMPNTPALVGAGAAGYALSPQCTDADAQTAQTILEAIGMAVRVPESGIDAVTALSGSGPAYFFFAVECLVRAAAAEGLSEDAAVRLAAQTLYGAGKLLIESGEPPSVLREKVTSKGGTTAAALAAFREFELERVLTAGVAAAAARSRELGR